MYDGIFEVGLPDGVSLVGYADDIAVVVEDVDWETTKVKMRWALENINTWLSGKGLQLAPEKTEVVTLKYGRRRREGKVQVADIEVDIAQKVKYVGVHVDASMSFGPHIRETAAKAQATVTALCKLMPNMGGPDENKRRTLAAAGESVLLYAAPIWAGAMRVAAYRNKLQGVQRKLALRVIRGYRTVSYDAAMVLSSMIPIHLLVEERRRIWERGGQSDTRETIKREERRRTIDTWQTEWDNSDKGRWTKELIPRIDPWINRKYGQVGYHLTQWLTGHGAFMTYKKRIGKVPQENCMACGMRDTPGHAVLECPAVTRIKIEAEIGVGEELKAENITRVMLQSKENWNLISRKIKCIMMRREQEERGEN